jgi:hypothetical protein
VIQTFIKTKEGSFFQQTTKNNSNKVTIKRRVIGMPVGILLIRWDDKLGTTLVAKYPDTFKFPSKILMNIYSQHRAQSTDPSFVTLTLTNMKISSFFSGMDENFIGASNYIIALVHRRDENPLIFRETLKKAAAKILKNVGEIKPEELEKVFFDMRALSK